MAVTIGYPGYRIEDLCEPIGICVLGTQSIEGVTVEGTRVTGPLTIETWTSPELKVDLIVRSSNGYSSKLIHLTRTEPDPALFRPPDDYRVVDDAAPFPMTIRFQK